MTSVIIIDDDKDLANVLSELLTLHNIDVLDVGHNGQDAVTLFQKHKPDCVLLDYLMPQYDGLHGVKEIRKISSFCKIIIITASVDPDIERKLLDNGANVVLRKPINTKELCAVLQ